ncbi:unnamed protein product [Euphydryas editha]|uniref:Reverse transcriptase domain-containing protein n=1 Tax=Euphydryas editha TaxID=104508 RepID=A0AAU9UF34_EUPED|nr:unnamed protein product [Euphydryas editha]
MLVQETLLKPSHRNPNIQNYRIIRNDRATARGGGTVIYYKRSLHCVPLDPPPLEGIEASMCQVSLTGHQPITIASVYLSPDKPLVESDVRSLLAMSNSVILAGDLNAKHPHWNSRVSNRHGVQLDLMTSLPSLGFDVIAPATPTRFEVRMTNDISDVLDIAILKGVTLVLRSIETLPELDSDHRPVLIQLGPDPQLALPTKVVTDWRRLDELLQTVDAPTLSDIPDRIDTVEAAETAANGLTSHIKSLINECSREVPIRPYERMDLPDDLKALIRRKNAAIRAHDRYPTDANRRLRWALLREVKARFAELREDRDSKRFGELAPSHVAYWALARALRRGATDPIPPLVRPNLPPALDDLDKAECLADSLESQCSPSSQPVDPEHLLKVDSEVDRLAASPPTGDPLSPTTVEEVESIIKSLHAKKAPGPDLISNKAIKRLPHQLVLLLVMIFNALLAGCSFPDQWKEATVIGIRKVGKPGNLPTSYRPISLLNALGKIYERIILARLRAIVEANSILINEQFGFRAGHSCVHQVHRITEHILAGFSLSKARVTGALFFDVAKAFDKVWHNGLIYKLHKLGLPDRLVLLIRDYLSNRTFRYRVEGTLSSPRTLRAGVPQGSCLSPLLYSLYTNDIPIKFAERKSVKMALYADDTALFTSSDRPDLISSRLQSVTDALGDWFRTWRIEINPDKSTAVFFTKVLNYRGRPDEITLYGTPIKWSDQVTYLGVTLDRRLTFRKHIIRVRNKAAFVLSRLHYMINSKSKMSLRNKTTLYKTCVRPVLTYGCPVFARCEPGLLQKLQVIQNRFLRKATASPWYIRNIDLHRDFEIDSIAKHIKSIAANYFEKARNHPNPLIAQSCVYNTLRGNFKNRCQTPPSRAHRPRRPDYASQPPPDRYSTQPHHTPHYSPTPSPPTETT